MNISPLLQQSITKKKLSKAYAYTSKSKDSSEPNLELDTIEYSKAIIEEYADEDGIINIIDHKNQRTIQILPNGTYILNSIKSGYTQKIIGNDLIIVNGDLTIKVNEDKNLYINVNGGSDPVYESVISFTKLQNVLNTVTVNVQGTPTPLTFVTPLTEENSCYENVKINKNA